MGYSKEIFDIATETLSQRRNTALATAQRHKEEFYAVCPRAREIESELSSLAARTARSVLQSGNTKSALERLRDQSLMLQKERAELMTENRLPLDWLEPKYTCPKCSDTGFVGGKACTCLRSLLRSESLRRLNAASALGISSFRDFSLDYYTGQDRTNMKKILSVCKDYASAFSMSSSSLLMMGGTGLGKTHLSLAIAGEVIEKNFGVLYGTVSSFARTLERERFSQPDDTPEGDLFTSLENCDLLILDDLGTEPQSAYLTSCISELIDARLGRKLPTIITTNLSSSDLQRRYGERTVSRIFGMYTVLGFSGSDIRLKKRSAAVGK